ncbi:MAG: hypothetical protein ACRCXB_34270 [Aeromonadaceae bacterium]
MSEKMRAEFELWFESSYGFSPSKDDKTTYSTPWVNDMFHAWKASRAALVVELPGLTPGGDGYMYEDAYACGQHDCIAEVKSLLDDAGVGYK